MTTEQIILTKLDKVLREVESLRKEQRREEKDEWISGKAVSGLTGWGFKNLRKYRMQKLIVFKKVGNTVRYNRKSVEELKSKLKN